MKSHPLLAVLGACLALPCAASAQTGEVTAVLKDGRAEVRWEAGAPPPQAGRLGFITEGDRYLALFRILGPEEQETKVQVLDLLWSGYLFRKQTARLVDLDAAPAPSDRGSLLVWSDRAGGAIRVNGLPAGRAPARIIVEPGTHEIVLDLPQGGKAGARIALTPGEEDVLCLHARTWPSSQGKGLSFYRHFTPGQRRKTGKAEPLRWLEDSQGNRVYFCDDPVKNPTLRQKIVPKYPESARKARREGKVFLDAVVGPDGRIVNLRVILGPGEDLSRAAVEAVGQWTYEPATLEGKPVMVFFNVTVEFYLSQ